MALVVFLRGVNVGGHKTFRPSALAKELADFDVVNVGAAGTFVIRKAVSQKLLRTELARRLPVAAEFMICPGRDLTALARRTSLPDEAAAEEVQQAISVLAARPRTLPPLPLSRPNEDAWRVRILEVAGRYAVSVWRRLGERLLYPNEVVEKTLGVSATTRNWNTLSTICAILQGSQ